MKQKPEHEMITRQEWDDHFWQHFNVLTRQHPEWNPAKRRKVAFSATEALHGPRPPSWRWLLVKLGWGLVKGGGTMDFSWAKNIWKAVRGALGVALAAAIYAGLDVLFQQFDTPEEWAAVGAPEFVIPLILAVLVSGRNWLKHKRRINMP